VAQKGEREGKEKKRTGEKRAEPRFIIVSPFADSFVIHDGSID
jgi:hypothetical protein